jgi:hypothetical protein
LKQYFLGQMAHNVPVIYDVFAVAIKEMRSNSSNRKNVVEQNTTKALAPTGILRNPNRRIGGLRK